MGGGIEAFVFTTLFTQGLAVLCKISFAFFENSWVEMVVGEGAVVGVGSREVKAECSGTTA